MHSCRRWVSSTCTCSREQKHEHAYEKLGAHVREMQGVAGVAFAVWAPNAAGVSVVGDFNGWDGRLNMMRMLGASGIWEIFVPDLAPGTRYKYEIRTRDGGLMLKADPFATWMEVPPATASVVFQTSQPFHATTNGWRSARAAIMLTLADFDLRGSSRLVAARARARAIAR